MTDREQRFEQPLPNSAECEDTILGAIILDNRLINQARLYLDLEDFYVPSRRRVYIAMLALDERGVELSPVLIGEEIKREGGPQALDAVGGISFITNLTYGLPHTSNLAHYVKVLKDKTARRWIIKEASKNIAQAYDEDDETVDILTGMIERPATVKEKLVPREVAGGPLVELTREVEDHLYRIKAGINPSLPTGISVLDSLTSGGIPPGETWGIGALSSKGKSSLLVQILKFMATQGEPVVLFSLEMKALSIALRILSGECGIPMNRLKVGLKDAEIEYLLTRAKTVFDVPIWIYTDCRSIVDIKARLKTLKRKAQIKAVGIDYYGLLSGYGGGRDRYENRTQELKYISSALQQQIAIEENVGLLIPAQFNRSGWGVKDPGPGNIDGGEAFYQACDLYATLGMESAKPGDKTTKAHLSVWKQRNGPTAMGKERIKLIFQRERMEFFPCAEDEGEIDEPDGPERFG